MAEPFLGQIIQVGFQFAPMGYATCDGQIMSIAQNNALFALLGTTYGGDGVTTFALPDIRGRVPLHQGQGPGLSNFTIGEVGGSENHTLITAELAQHNHMFNALNTDGNKATPVANVIGAEGSGNAPLFIGGPGDAQMNAQMIAASGGSQPHSILQPLAVINYCIALEGIFPSRN